MLCLILFHISLCFRVFLNMWLFRTCWLRLNMWLNLWSRNHKLRESLSACHIIYYLPLWNSVGACSISKLRKPCRRLISRLASNSHAYMRAPAGACMNPHQQAASPSRGHRNKTWIIFKGATFCISWWVVTKEPKFLVLIWVNGSVVNSLVINS